MKSIKHYFLILLFLAAACSSGSDAPVANINKNGINVNKAASPAPSVASNSAAAPSSDSGIAQTINAHLEALHKKDEAAFRKTLSAATLQEFSREAQTEKAKSLVEYWGGLSETPPPPYETRNEKIAGNEAIVEIKNSKNGRWNCAKLIKENNEWKMDITEAAQNQLFQLCAKQ
jgi:hypothetical protein